MSWVVKLVKFEGGLPLETTYQGFFEAKAAYDEVPKIAEDQRAKAIGRVRLCANNGTTLYHGLIGH